MSVFRAWPIGYYKSQDYIFSLCRFDFAHSFIVVESVCFLFLIPYGGPLIIRIGYNIPYCHDDNIKFSL